jgi:copper chaperone CopZ
MTRLELNVDEMGCGGCVKKVRQALSEVPGAVVEDVTVGKAVVSFDPATSSEAAVIAALGEKNYPATKIGSASSSTAIPVVQGDQCGI